MPITSSVIAEDARQRDGRRWIREVHTDHVGRELVFIYLAAAVFDAVAALAERRARLEGDITAQEVADNVNDVVTNGSEATISLEYSTIAQNVAGVRAAYQNATRLEAIMIGDWLNARTDALLRVAFGLTAAQVTTLRTNKLTPAANAAATIRATTGA